MAAVPLVSIICITFDHEGFIKATLEGFLAQRTDFPFEVIIHDDHSSDGTAAIIREYAAEHPNIFVPVLQTENQYSKGRKPWTVVFPMVRGRYIAMCEGDDHWIDPAKLQRQVDALEADQEAVGCFTDAWNEMDGVRSSYMDGLYANKPAVERLDQRTMILGQNIPACTIMVRREAAVPLPSILNKSPVGDTVLYVHVTRMGPLLYLPGHTAVRTMHAGGVHSLKSKMQKYEVQWKLLPILDEVSGGRYTADIERRLTCVALTGWSEALGANDRKAMERWWKEVVKRSDAGWTKTTKWRNWMKIKLPLAERWYGRLMDGR